MTIVPITSNVRRVYPFQVLLSIDDSGLPVPGKAQAEQVRSLSVERVVRIVGAVSSERMAALDAALRRHLDL